MLSQLADIVCVVHTCTLLHQRYAEFSVLLLQEFEKHLQGGIDKSEDKVTKETDNFLTPIIITKVSDK